MRSYCKFFLLALALIVTSGAAPADEIRGVWVDAWGAGMHNQTEVETMLGRPGDPNSIGLIREANLNAVFVQVRRRADVAYPSSMGEPYMSGLTPSNFNALQALINAAHDTTGGKQRIEVHAWIVAFATSSGGNPPANSIYYQHNNPADPDNYWVTLDNQGNETNDRALDPGHPLCQEYLADVCMDIIENFDVDGLHYDYIRFTGNNQGYNPVSVARFNERYNRTGTPDPQDPAFKQWRRDQVTDLVRKVYARTMVVKPHVKISGAFVTWNPSPTASTRSSFMNTRPYYDVYSDWDGWMQEGIIDLAVPMTYYNWASLPNDYVRWMNFQKDRKANRHVAVGPGIYLNSLSNAIREIKMTRDPSPAGNYGQGFVGYSYRVPYTSGNFNTFKNELIKEVTPTRANIPDMPWKSSPTVGHLMGQVTDFGTGNWLDGAVVSVAGPANRSMTCDGTGFFAFIDLPPGSYMLTASKAGYPQQSVPVSLGAGDAIVQDVALGGNQPPAIFDVQAGSITDQSVLINWSTNVPGTTQVEWGTSPAYGNLSPQLNDPVTSHSVSLTGLAPATTYHYRVISTNEHGTSTSADMVFTTSGPPEISSVQVSAISATQATVTWSTTTPSNTRVNYGLSETYDQQSPLLNDLVTEHSITLIGLVPSTTYHFQAVSSNPYGTDASADAQFSTGSFSGEIVVDGTGGEGFNFLTGTWEIASAYSKVGNDYFWTWGTQGLLPAQATHRARWRPDLPVSGEWDVYIWYARGTNRAENAYWLIVNAESPREHRVNQQIDGNGWTLISQDVPFHRGLGGWVELGNNIGRTDKIVQGDAVRFVYKGGDLDAPGAPQGLDAAPVSPESIQMNWTEAWDDHGVDHYKVYAGLDAAGTTPDTSYLLQGLLPNTAYTLQVSAVDAAQNEGVRATKCCVVTLSAPPTAENVIPSTEAGVPQASGEFSFTAVGGFGPGTLNHYLYAWNTSPQHGFDGSEALWSSGDLDLTATQPGAYYLHVKGYNQDAIPNGELALGPFVYEDAAPAVLSVNDGKYTASADTISASWEVENPELAARYEYSVGSTPGAVDVLDWTDGGLALGAEITGLALNRGSAYFVSVRAISETDVVSEAVTSSGVTVAYVADSIGAAKSYPDETPVYVGAVALAAILDGSAYVQQPDRSSGIRLEGAFGLPNAAGVDVFGRLALGENGERMLVDVLTIPNPSVETPVPLTLALRMLGGGPLNDYTPGVTSGIGLNTLGLLVDVYGMVAETQTGGFYLNVGSLQSPGLWVELLNGTAAQGNWVRVLGVSSSQKVEGDIVPTIRALSVTEL